ncbi:MAG: hypothetical protein OWT27_10100 [Firmicutes bacterium]|nr:hypothetical protein [Bacillota bacterium]
MKIKQMQFDEFILPSYEIIQPLLSRYSGAGVVEFNRECQPGDIESALYRLKKLVQEKRLYINDSMYFLVIDLEVDSEQFSIVFKQICKEIVRLYFARKFRWEIRDQLPLKTKWKAVYNASWSRQLGGRKVFWRKWMLLGDIVTSSFWYMAFIGFLCAGFAVWQFWTDFHR